MRKTARLLTAAAVITSLGFASAATAHAATAPAPASAKAPAPGWRIAATFPAGSTVDDLAVSGPDSAWAVEQCIAPCKSSDSVILRHWNGRAWSVQPQPALSKHMGISAPLLATAPGSKDLWAVYNGGGPRAVAVEWTGKCWGRAALFPAGVGFTSVVAAGPSDVWAFGGKFAGALYAARFNGRRGRRRRSPARV